jgi:hypothetical protein
VDKPVKKRPALNARLRTELVLIEVARERALQDEKWGEQNHPNGTSRDEWLKLATVARKRTDSEAVAGKVTFQHILEEEVFEAFAEEESIHLRHELIQVAAVAVQWVEALDRKEKK